MLALLLLSVFVAVSAEPVRICVPETLAESCRQMSSDLPDTFTCVVEPDKLGCLNKVSVGEADLTNANPRAIYAGGKHLQLVPVATELVDGETYRYQGIALVTKDSDVKDAADLKGRSSCHTGLGRTVGWQIPIGKLLDAGIMQYDCQEGELATAANFFGGSCVPGNWSTDPIVDRDLKSKYSVLCSSCKNSSLCSSDDEYAGYEGVMKCLAEGAGQVAFTKIPALRKYLTSNPEFADTTEVLCFNGERMDVHDPQPCVWDSRPTNAYVTSSGKSTPEMERIVSALMETQTRYSVPQVPTPDWYYKSFLSGSDVSGLKATDPERNTYLTYLRGFVHAIRKPRPNCLEEADSVSFCVTSAEELQKCKEYACAAEARDLFPDLKCFQAESKAACMQHVKNGHCQLVVLDGGDVYKAGRYFDLQPVSGELYGESVAKYFAVAVLRSASNVTRLADLRGVRSCHTGMGRTAGWVMPVGTLLTEGLISSEGGCNRAEAVADFFSAGSCVPGANDTETNPDRTRSEDLCRQCIGDEQGLYKCSRDSRERFSGYAGALRCLAEGQGDVAFVKHSTVSDYTDGRSTAPWTKDLLSSDFILLCPKTDRTAATTQYVDCNLGRVPSHYVMTSGEASKFRRLQLARFLADSSRYFADDSDLFRLFHTNRGSHPDLLFKDSATGLRAAPMDASYEQVLGQEFLAASQASDPKSGCTI